MTMNKPIYGTQDAGRRFYKTFRRRALAEGLVECKLCRSLYTCRDKEGRNAIMAGAHVHDVLWAAEPQHEHLILGNLLQHFELNQVEEGECSFCGREYSQIEDFGVYITRKSNTETILPISFVKGVRGFDDKATAAEIAQARSVIRSLSWIARQARPDLCYQTSRLQSVVSAALVEHSTQCIKVLQGA